MIHIHYFDEKYHRQINFSTVIKIYHTDLDSSLLTVMKSHHLYKSCISDKIWILKHHVFKTYGCLLLLFTNMLNFIPSSIGWIFISLIKIYYNIGNSSHQNLYFDYIRSTHQSVKLCLAEYGYIGPFWYFPESGWVGEMKNIDHLSPAKAETWNLGWTWQ